MNRQKNYNSVRKRICKKVLAVLFFLGVPVLVFLFSFNIKKADVVGTDRYTDSEIREYIIQSRLDYNSIYLYLKYQFFVTPEIPFVEKIDVEMVDRHRVKITVYEKIIAGCVEFMGEYLYFDKDGIIVESSPKKIEKIPIINGLEYDEIILHQKLNVHNDKDGLFDTIINITKLNNKYDLGIDEVYFSKNYEVTIRCNNIKIFLGKKEHYDEPLSDLKNILEKAKGTDVYELDMRNYKKGTGYVPGKTKKNED